MSQILARKMTTWAWVTYSWNNAMAVEHPRSARVDPFGNPHVAQMSPSSRNFRLYCQGITEDIIDQVDPESIILDGLHYYPWDHGLPNQTALVRLSPFQKFLLGLDFSDGVSSMAKKYEVSVDDLQGQIAAYLQDSLRRDPSEEEMEQEITEEFLSEKFDGMLNRYLVAREAASSMLFENIARMVRGRKKKVNFCGSTQPLETGLDFFRMRKSIDRYIIRVTDDVRDMEEQMKAFRAVILPTSEIIARVAPADFASEDGFLNTLKAMVNHGVNGFAFYNFGLLRPVHLKWIEAAREFWESEPVTT
jgi:hypothetical protein